MKRFILDDDGSNVLNVLHGDVFVAAQEAARECPPQVTTYMVCSGAGRCFWPTKIGDVADKYPAMNKAIARGDDPFLMRLEAYKAAGKETFITHRMNDVHNPDEGWNTPRFRREHPDCIVGADEVNAGKAQWMSYCMDYTRDDVRAYVLSLIAEQIKMYGHIIDGFQLDWMRFPRHLSGTPDEVWQKPDVLTQFTAAVREIVGSDIQLAVRVPTTLAGCRHMGIDLAAWSQQKLIDMVITCPFLTTDWQIPIGDFREALGGTTIPVYAGFDLGFGPQVHFPESYRGICTSLYDCNPDGLYLFNFPCWTERLAARPYHWLNGLDDPKTAAAKPLLFAVNHQRSRKAGVDAPAVTPATLAPGGDVNIPMYIPKAALPAWRAMCLADCGGDMDLVVNGVPAHREPPPYRSEIFLEFVNHYRPKTLRAEPDHCRTFRIDPTVIRPGDNTFTFHNANGEARCLQRINLALW